MKYKYKKIILYIWTILFIFLTLIEFIKYIKESSELLGMIYQLINIFIIFLLVPILYNYKRHYSKARISKLILVIIFGIFNSYILKYIVISCMSYTDTSILYDNSIFIIKYILKGILYFVLIGFTYIESRTVKISLKKS